VKTLGKKDNEKQQTSKSKGLSNSKVKASTTSKKASKGTTEKEVVEIKRKGKTPKEEPQHGEVNSGDLIIPPKKEPKKKEDPAKKLYQLLTEEDSATEPPEEIDPEALARGDKPMTVVEHLDELRSRVLNVLVAFIVITCVAFYFSDTIVYYINKPFLDSGNKLNIFTLIGGFMLKFKVSAASAFLILVPIIIFHIWRFIVPAIEVQNRMFSRVTIISAVILFYSGVAFVFFVLLPAAIKVMLSFVGPEMISTIGAEDYLSFIIFSCLIMGILFEVPVIILVLTRLGLISPQFLINKRKYAIVIIWIIAAIVTPQPDPFSQSLVGVPLMLLYEISILISKIVARRERRKLNITKN